MGEGDGDVGEDGGGVGEDRGDDDGPGGVPARPEARGREPPSFFFLDLPLDGGTVSPLVHGFHGGGGAKAPPRLDLSLCLSLFLCSLLALFHRFVYIWRSVTLIGLNFGHDLYPNISLLVAKEGHQPPIGQRKSTQTS